VSSLWTPSGEHPVGRATSGEPPRPGRQPRPGSEPGGRAPGQEPTPDEVRQAEEELAAVREQLARAPVEVVVANHAMGLFDLAALHLSQQPPQLPQAQLAIDALGALVEGLTGRLGEAERTLSDGLAQLRMAFVQIANAERARQGADSPAQ
jgi:hypothetical protein